MHHKKSLEHLSENDPVMAGLILRVKLKPRSPVRNYFQALVRSIVSQQLSTKAAATILARFVGLFGKEFPTPKQVVKMKDEKLREAGLSYQKISYIKNLCRAIIDGSVDFNKFDDLDDEEIINRLTRIKGIGRWTVEMFLIMSMGRLDIFSYGDLGLKNGLKKFYNIDIKKNKRKLEKLLQTWAPYKTVASRLLWAALELKDEK